MKEFKNISQFVRAMRETLETLPEAGHAAMESAAEVVLKEQKRIIGTYQRDNLPSGVSPWAELADSTKEARMLAGATPNRPGLVTGEMRETYHKKVGGVGLVVEASVGSDDQHAVWFEEGNEGQGVRVQPPRAISAVAGFRKEEAVRATLGSAIAFHLAGKPRLEAVTDLDMDFDRKMQED